MTKEEMRRRYLERCAWVARRLSEQPQHFSVHDFARAHDVKQNCAKAWLWYHCQRGKVACVNAGNRSIYTLPSLLAEKTAWVREQIKENERRYRANEAAAKRRRYWAAKERAAQKPAAAAKPVRSVWDLAA